MKEGSPSLFSYPTNQHEWGHCSSAAKLGQNSIFFFLTSRFNQMLKVELETINVWGCKDNGS